MKNFMICLVYTLVAVSSQAQPTAEETALIDLEKQLTVAIAEHKEDVLNGLFDNRYHGVTPAGQVVDKTKWLDLLKTNNPYVFFSTEDIKVAVYINMAVVTGKVVGKSKTGSLIGQSRFIHVLIKRNGLWRIIEEQGTIVVQE